MVYTELNKPVTLSIVTRALLPSLIPTTNEYNVHTFKAEVLNIYNWYWNDYSLFLMEFPKVVGGGARDHVTLW